MNKKVYYYKKVLLVLIIMIFLPAFLIACSNNANDVPSAQDNTQKVETNEQANVSESEKVGLKIVANAEKNANSKSSEIWLQNITVNGKKIDLTALTSSKEWKKDVNYYILTHGKKSTVDFGNILTQNDTVKIYLLKHKWAGKVEINVGEEKQLVDLYDTTEEPEVLTFTVK